MLFWIIMLLIISIMLTLGASRILEWEGVASRKMISLAMQHAKGYGACMAPQKIVEKFGLIIIIVSENNTIISRNYSRG